MCTSSNALKGLITRGENVFLLPLEPAWELLMTDQYTCDSAI